MKQIACSIWAFKKELDKIVGAMPRKRQTLLFSATFPAQIESLAKKLMRTPEKVVVAERTR